MSAIEETNGINVSVKKGANLTTLKSTALTNYDGLTVIPNSVLKNIDLSSVPAVIQEAIDKAKLDAITDSLASSIIADLREDINVLEDGIYKKQYIDTQLIYLQEILQQKANEDTIASIADARTVLALDGYATTNQISVLSSRVGNSESEILKVKETINTKDSARALQIDQVEARVNENLSIYSNALDLEVDSEGNVKAQKIEELKITVTDQNGDINALKKQVDGKVEYHEGIYSAVKSDFKPALVEPYKTWYETDIANGDTLERAKHTGDTFEQYQIIDGVNEYLASWKFVKTDLSFANADADGYCWSVITNSVALDAYKKAVQAQQQNAALEVTLNETNTLLNTVQGWSANASKLITDASGNITGWAFGDGSNVKSFFRIIADKFEIATSTGGKKPFRIEDDEIFFNGKTTFSNTTDVPNFQTDEDVISTIEETTIITKVADNFEQYKSHDALRNKWKILSGTSLPFRSSVSSSGRYALGVGSHDIAESNWLEHQEFLGVNPTDLYMVKAKVRRYNAETLGKCYIGVICYKDDKVTRLNTTGSNTHSGAHYVAASSVTLTNTHIEYVGYFKGQSTTDVGGQHNDPSNPAKLYTGTKFVRGIFIANYPNKIGFMYLDDFSIEKVETDYASKKALTAEQNAINEAQNKVNLAKTELNNTINALPDVNITENAITRIPNPIGGTFVGSSTTTGALVIELPQFETNTMVSFDIDVFDYQLNHTFTLKVSGYVSSSVSKWYQTSANLIGSTEADNKVTFSRTSSKNVIIIGETNTVWKYPKVTVRNLMASYRNYTIDQWKDGWNIKVITSLSGYTAVRTYADALIDARSIKNQGALATQNSVNLNQLPDDVKNSNIHWQSEVQNAINNDLTTVDGGKIVTNEALVNNLNAMGGIVAEDVIADTFYGKRFEGSVFVGAVIRTSYLDLDGELQVLTNYHISVATYNASPNTYSDAVYIKASNEYRIPSISQVTESGSKTIASNSSIYGSIHAYNIANIGNNKKAVKKRPVFSNAPSTLISFSNPTIKSSSANCSFDVKLGTKILCSISFSTSAAYNLASSAITVSSDYTTNKTANNNFVWNNTLTSTHTYVPGNTTKKLNKIITISGIPVLGTINVSLSSICSHVQYTENNNEATHHDYLTISNTVDISLVSGMNTLPFDWSDASLINIKTNSVSSPISGIISLAGIAINNMI